MRFQEADEGWHGGALTQSVAAQLVEVCERSFRRYLTRYEAHGFARARCGDCKHEVGACRAAITEAEASVEPANA